MGRPIGIYDSGVGGLTVWSSIKYLTQENVIYYGDTAYVPYGDKTAKEIICYSKRIIDFLLTQGVKGIIAACNTSTALALPELQPVVNVPLFGVIEPAVTKAAALTKNNKVGVIATSGTIQSQKYQQVFAEKFPDIKLIAVSTPKLVPLIESSFDRNALYQILRVYLSPMMQEDIDTLILGCTHYPFLAKEIKEICGADVHIVDPARQTVNDVLRWLIDTNQLNDHYAYSNFWVSGKPDEFKKRTLELLDFDIGEVRQHKLINYNSPEIAVRGKP